MSSDILAVVFQVLNVLILVGFVVMIKIIVNISAKMDSMDKKFDKILSLLNNKK